MVALIRALHTFWLLGAGTLPVADGDVRLDPRTPFYEIESRLLVGNKGEELIDVSVQASCGEVAWVFDHAELIVRRNRFGDAQFVDLPARGCSECSPIRLRWYHEPTGYLSIAVHVYRRPEVLQCPIRDRSERSARLAAEDDSYETDAVAIEQIEICVASTSRWPVNQREADATSWVIADGRH